VPLPVFKDRTSVSGKLQVIADYTVTFKVV
jgi:hypothetical protein